MVYADYEEATAAAVRYRGLQSRFDARANHMVRAVLVKLCSGRWVKVVPFEYKQAHRRAAGYAAAARRAERAAAMFLGASDDD